MPVTTRQGPLALTRKNLISMITYLYVKTHTITGLKYLGKTIEKDPHKYPGSGKYWRLHLKKHGKHYTTEILKECQHPAMVEYWGQYYSDLWNIVDSDEWANLKPEAGDGGKGTRWTEEMKQKARERSIANGSKPPSRPQHGEHNPMYGKKHSEESRAKMRKRKVRTSQ